MKLQKVKWGEFKLGDLFEIGTGSLINLQSAEHGKVPRVSVKTTDNGIIGYFVESVENARYFENFISVNFFGISYYHPYRASVEMKVHTLKFKNRDFTKAEGSFISAMINKGFNGLFSYGTQLSSSKLKNNDFKIQLPAKNSKIDFEFIESFIAELEAERLAELEAYLLATGLKDYSLTIKEQQVLDDFENVKFEFGEFTYKSIFNKIVQGRRLKKDDQILGNIPFVMAGTTNTGVVNYISNPVACFPKNSITIDIFGNTFYRDYAFGAGDDTGIYWDDEKKYSKETMLFFTGAMGKSIIRKFDFGNKLRSSKSLNFKMKLPTLNKQPNYEIMETFISAIQKLVIKDVVLYAERKIEATKEMVISK